jgi:hypothetical protein
MSKTLNPVWNYVIQKEFQEGSKIQIDLYHYVFLGFDKYMGSCFFTIAESMSKQPLTNLELPVLNDSQQ